MSSASDSIMIDFLQKALMWDTIKCLAEVQDDHVSLDLLSSANKC